MDYTISCSHLPEPDLKHIGTFFKQRNIHTCNFKLPENAEITAISNICKNHYSSQRAIGLKKTNFIPKAIFFDMDGTLIRQESSVELDRKVGKYELFDMLTKEAMQGQVSFSVSFSSRLKMLEGITKNDVMQTAKELDLQPGIVDLVEVCKKKSIALFLISGGLLPFAKYFSDILGFADYCASDVSYREDGSIYLKESDLVVTGEYKLQWMREICKKNNWHENQVVAVGDGANDQCMIEKAGLGVGFCPHDVLKPYLDVFNDTGNHKFLVDFLNI